MVTSQQIAELQAAMAHQQAGRLSEAAKAYNRLLQQMPGNFGCVYSLAMIYAQQGNLDAAAKMFGHAAQLRPDLADVHYNLAVALSMAGRFNEAALSYEKVLKIDPRHANARNNYATTLLQAGRPADALRQYDELIANSSTAKSSVSADAYNNRGMALQALKRSADAIVDYDKAIALRPDFAEAHVNRGNALADLHRTDEALASYRAAVALRPDFADAYNNIGNIYYNLGSYEQAVAAYDTGLSLQPDDSEARSNRFSAKLHLCDWSNFAEERTDLLASVRRGLPTYPFVMLAVSSSVEDHLQCAKHFSRARFPRSEAPLWRGEIYAHDRIRLAYVSGDFREHPIAYLTASLFEHHDRSRFEVTAISFGPDHDRPITRRLKSAFEHYVDARAMSDVEIADWLRRQEIDIAVDLVGYLQNARTTIFSRRPAPIQVNYIGYPGTLGADYFDYILADPIVVPPEHAAFYSEKVAWLPDTYLSTDATRPVAPTTPARRELGLPEDGFVFCCFNLLYKNNPDMFDVWMRLLRQIENSVLWLRDYNTVTTANLRGEAQRRGIAPERLIFAPRVPNAADHLARQRQADLFLDTLPYNAHTTGTEALWAGLPVLTCLGSSFAGRVGASINNAIGMPELVTRSPAEYEALALKIARDPALCASLKAKLARHRGTYPLFDTARLTRNVEAAYRRMWQIYRDGRAPENFAVESRA
jgi:predicted O-linked N-acetylglucosamine transferase (SPINDLY family)